MGRMERKLGLIIWCSLSSWRECLRDIWGAGEVMWRDGGDGIVGGMMIGGGRGMWWFGACGGRERVGRRRGSLERDESGGMRTTANLMQEL